MLLRPSFSIAFALLALTTGAAAAETPTAVFSRYELLGAWASDCKKPPGPANWFVTHSPTNTGSVQTQYDHGGGGAPLLSVVDSARPLSTTTLDIHVKYTDAKWGTLNGSIFTMIVEVSAGRTHTVQSIRNDGMILIKESKFATDGRPSQILYKCPGGRPNA